MGGQNRDGPEQKFAGLVDVDGTAMARKRPGTSGSFASELGELIKHFPPAERSDGELADSRNLQEKKDIHALLFAKAWRLDG